jgi:purine-binding chemotaxis protein CheW
MLARKAGQTQQQAVATDDQQYLTFTLKNEIFAIGILRIKEILEYDQLTPVPMMPLFIRGVINLRGAVVPVVDLAARFHGKANTVTRRTCIVIIEVQNAEGRQDIGILVDTVCEVLAIADREIEPPPAFGARIRTDFIQGMGKVNQKFVIILAVDKVLSIEELSQLQQLAD